MKAGLLLVALLLLGAAPADDAFVPWKEHEGVSIQLARVEKSPPWVRATVELDATPDAVAAVLSDFAAYKEIFDPVLRKANVLDAREGGARMHLVWPFPWPMKSRDAVVDYSIEKGPDGSWLLSWKGDARKGDPTLGVRILGIEGSTKVEPLDEGRRSRVTYTYLGDLGGDFGKSANEKAWKGQPPHYFKSLEKRLVGKARPR